MGQLSYAQSVSLKVISNLAACLSIVGSSLIVASIFRQHNRLKHLKESSLHQLLLGLSICDIFYTFVTLAAGLFNPRESNEVQAWAVGNKYSCSVGGFIYIFFATAANFYNMFLSIHFWRKITAMKRRGISSQSTKQKDLRFRLGAHSTSLFVPLLFGVAGLVTNSYHPHDFVGFCYYTQYPHGCDKDPNIECEGGTNAQLLGRLRTGVICFIALVSIAVTIMLAIYVWRNINRSRKYSLARQPSHTSTQAVQQLRFSESNSNSDPYSTQTQSQNRPNNSKQREVAIQAIWYMLAHTNSFVFILAASIVTQATENRGNPGPFAMLILLSFFQPLQGALNFIVFIRPRYKSWKSYFEKQQQRDPENNPIPLFCTILKKAILEQVPSSRQPAPGGRIPPHDKYMNDTPELDQGQRTKCTSNPYRMGLKNSSLLPHV